LLPGLDAVRVLRALRFGVYLAATFLAGWGVHVLCRRLRATGKAVLTAALVALALVETFRPPSFLPRATADPELVAHDIRPPREVVELYASLPDGAVLDLPLRWDLRGKLVQMPEYTLLGAFHGRPFAACYNSFLTPLQTEVAELVRRLPDVGAADALHALGFRTLVVHRDHLPATELERLAPFFSNANHVVPFRVAPGKTAYRLRTPVPVSVGYERLVPADNPGAPAEVVTPRAAIDFTFANPPDATYAAPPPVEPVPLIARWRDSSGAILTETQSTALLPIALAPGWEGLRSIEVDVPEAAGSYQVEIALASAPDRPLARRPVNVKR
jgi:hypothetical protein